MTQDTITITMSDLTSLWDDAVQRHGDNAAHEVACVLLSRLQTALRQELRSINSSVYRAYSAEITKRTRIYADALLKEAIVKLREAAQ